MGNAAFSSAKKLMERLYLLGLFKLSMIFQNLGYMVFRAVDGVAASLLSLEMLRRNSRHSLQDNDDNQLLG